MNQATYPIELITDGGGDTTAIPAEVIVSMYRSGQIPLVDVKWADERRWCRYAHAGAAKGAAQCPELRFEPGCSPWCGLNGYRVSACAFDEPESAAIWSEIEAGRAEEKRLGVVQ